MACAEGERVLRSNRPLFDTDGETLDKMCNLSEPWFPYASEGDPYSPQGYSKDSIN